MQSKFGFQLRAQVRRFNRLRWWGKPQNVRRHGGRGSMSRRSATRPYPTSEPSAWRGYPDARYVGRVAWRR